MARSVAPDGACIVLQVGSDAIANLIGHPTVKSVTLTGSERAGETVAAEAGK